MKMRRIILVAIVLAVLAGGCETAPKKQVSRKSEADAPVGITVGGEVQVRGQYLDRD